MNPETLADERLLVKRLQAADEEACATTVTRYTGRLLAAARRLLGNEEEAQEAVQDAFLSFFRSLDRFDGGARLYTWLHRILINAALMKLRARRRRPEVAIEELLPRFYEDGHRVDPGAPWPDTPLDELARKECRQFVRRGLDRLPVDYRAVLVLRDIEQLDTKTAAELLGTTPGALKVRLHRARQALRTVLDPDIRSIA